MVDPSSKTKQELRRDIRWKIDTDPEFVGASGVRRQDGSRAFRKEELVKIYKLLKEVDNE